MSKLLLQGYKEMVLQWDLRGVGVNPIQEGYCWVWKHEIKKTANLREFSQIAFFLRRRALLRLITSAESHPLLKNAEGKTRVRVFLFLYYFSYDTNREPT